jgi:NB-ARC domain
METEFIEAGTNWHLERLYIDLAEAKGKSLTPMEKKLLRGLLCGYSPLEIAMQIYQTSSSSSVRVYLSNFIYKYLQELIFIKTGKTVKVNNWNQVTNFLEKSGYKKQFLSNNCSSSLSGNQVELEEETRNKIFIKNYSPEFFQKSKFFYGRKVETNQLERWILDDHCRLIGIFGMMGIGKSTLVLNTIPNLYSKFEFCTWRSLGEYQSINDLITHILNSLASEQLELPTNTEDLTEILMSFLSAHRCLILLDGMEHILSPKNPPKNNLEAMKYAHFWQKIATINHQSCIIVTSREKTTEIAMMTGDHLPVREMEIKAIDIDSAEELFRDKGLIGSREETLNLLKNYGGNPLFLKIVASTIKDLFDGNISEFLAQNTLIYGDVANILDQQFEQLSAIEKKVLYWLALHHRLVPLYGLREQLIPGMSKRQQIEAYEKLQRRSLITKTATIWTTTPILREYILEKLTEQVCEEMSSKDLAVLLTNKIISSHSFPSMTTTLESRIESVN